jgi:monoamine oxidase
MNPNTPPITKGTRHRPLVIWAWLKARVMLVVTKEPSKIPELNQLVSRPIANLTRSPGRAQLRTPKHQVPLRQSLFRVKYLMRFEKRFWEEFFSSPTLTEDGPVDATWETTEADKKRDYALAAFSGADDASKCVGWPRKDKKRRYMRGLEEVYPGIQKQLRKARFMDWPREEWTKASCYSPRVNEVTEWDPFWKAGYKDYLHFAGEHTSYAFTGYMEGALTSGYRLARRLAVRDKVLPA